MDPDEEPRKRPEAPPIEWLKPGETQAPAPEPSQPAAWIPRPEDYQRRAAWPEPARPSPRRGLNRAAGVCLVLAGLIGIMGSVYSTVYPPSPEQVANLTAGLDAATVTFLYLCGLVSVYAQAFALLGGVLAYQGRSWKLVLACAVMSLFSLGLVLFESSLLGALGLVFVLMSKRDFSS